MLFIAAALMSVGLFASKDVVPADNVLSDYYNPGDVCVCIYVPADINCYDIVLTGSFNNWSTVAANCPTFQSVEGYDGWYVASFEPEAEPDPEKGIQAKPVIKNELGLISLKYQAGAATPIRGGVQMQQGASAGEMDFINYGTDAPNVFTVEAWKKNPCTEVFYQYAVRYADEVEFAYLKVGDRLAAGTKILGDDNLEIRVKGNRYRVANDLMATDFTLHLGELNGIGANGLIETPSDDITPVNAKGTPGIEWEVVSVDPLGTGPLGTGPLELVGVGSPNALNYVHAVACIDVKAGDTVSAGGAINGVGYIRFIGGSYKLNGVFQENDSEVLEIEGNQPYCNADGKFIVGENVYTPCDPEENDLNQWLCLETGPLSTGPLGTGPLGTGPLAFQGTGVAKVKEPVVVAILFPTENVPTTVEIATSNDQWESGAAMELLERGWHMNSEIEAYAEDTLIFRDANNHETVLCQYVPGNGGGDGKWEVVKLVFGDEWTDDTWKGVPVKFIELELNEAAQYAWTVAGTTGVNDVEGNNAQIFGGNQRIVINNAEAANVAIYDVMGRTVVKEQRINSNNAVFAMPQRGMYIVRMGNAAKKVFVK